MDTKKVDQVFETSDLNLAAYLVATGFKLLRQPFNPTGKHFTIFTFAPSPEITQASLNFFNKQAPIDAATYGESVRSLVTSMRVLNKGGRENE